ncbi:flagellar biosynthesis anti-sigma factor FlgM [Ideonella sp. 4Y16]|uniref:Negative regulator of flagellin synthesis n=1 Tax=Ideonella alba TaxID=2824118 RepID=A0A940Y3T5_9BURK|nr:flagellar biosynthesis anti-sigma factor FlgM [Ideonella alba]MBQ0929769.1 flagellar biosynthesis anti-sigma factor FlgM [Ideonella alba]MBQ0942009.1 flagellar biosynthesis anti-sigma factor FlgM [Ideonella alba]
MKIGSFDPKSATNPLADTRTRGAKSDKSDATEATDSAQVSLSATGSAIAQAGADPSFDAAKVERIAQAIRDGKFQVNPEKIADKLIANAQDLLKRYSDH